MYDNLMTKAIMWIDSLFIEANKIEMLANSQNNYYPNYYYESTTIQNNRYKHRRLRIMEKSIRPRKASFYKNRKSKEYEGYD